MRLRPDRLHLAPIAFAAAALPLVACSASYRDDDGRAGIAASGSGGERRYAVTGFDAVSLAAAGDVDVRTGQSFAVSVTGDPAVLDTLKVTRDGKAVVLGRRNGMHLGNAGRIHWTVTMPRIAGASIGGSGSIRIDRVEAASFEGDIGGSGNLAIAAMKAGKARFAIGGSGNVDAAGTTDALDVSIGGSGKLRLLPLVAQTASVSIAGSGTVAATVRTKADVTIVGAGNVRIAGGAKCSVTKMGAGTVDCG